MNRNAAPIVDIRGLEDLRVRYEVLGKYAFADALQDAVNALADLTQMRMAKGFERAIEGGPARFTEIRPGSRSSSVVTRKARGATKGIASADVFVQAKQVRYLQYMLGENDVREPGEVGVAIKANFVPIEDNLRLVGISLTEQGGLPRGGLKRLVALAKRGKVEHGLRKNKATELFDAGIDRMAGTSADRTLATVFFGTPKGKPKSGRARGAGFWMRPGVRKDGLKLLAAALPESDYGDDTYLVPAWNDAVEGAAKSAYEIVRETLEARLDGIFSKRRAASDRKNDSARAERLARRMATEARGEKVNVGQLHSAAKRRQGSARPDFAFFRSRS